MSRRIGVVLFNLGGPDSLEAVKPFLFNLFNDKAIIGLPQPFRRLLAWRISSGREEEAKANYAHMGGSSPLQRETELQRQALEIALATALPGDVVKVVTAMRYWRPLTQEAAAEMASFKPDELVLLPLYPQYSTTTTGSSLAAWRRMYRGGAANMWCAAIPTTPASWMPTSNASWVSGTRPIGPPPCASCSAPTACPSG